MRQRWIAALCVLVSCTAPPPGPDTVARMGGEEVPHERFRDHLETILMGVEPDADALPALFDRFLEELLLVRLASEALPEVAEVDPDEAVRQLIEAEITPPPTAELSILYRERYRAARGELRLGLRQLLLTRRELAEQARFRLGRGEPFESVAVSLTLEPDAAQAWIQSEVEEGDLPETLWVAVSDLEVGGVSEVIEVEYGFLVFQVANRELEEAPPLGRVENGLRADLTRQRLQEARTRLVERASRRYDLTVFERNLPFTYQGRFSPQESH